MKIVDGIDMAKVKAGELKDIISAFNKAKVGVHIKPGANPLGSAKAFVKAVESLDDDKQVMLPESVSDYYNMIVIDEDELAKLQGKEEPETKKPDLKPVPSKKSTPAPVAKKPESKAGKKPAVAKAPKEQMPEKNGIRQPKPGGLCAQAWAIFDSLSKRKKGAIPAIADALKIAEEKGLNPGNVRAEFPRWKKFNS